MCIELLLAALAFDSAASAFSAVYITANRAVASECFLHEYASGRITAEDAENAEVLNSKVTT